MCPQLLRTERSLRDRVRTDPWTWLWSLRACLHFATQGARDLLDNRRERDCDFSVHARKVRSGSARFRNRKGNSYCRLRCECHGGSHTLTNASQAPIGKLGISIAYGCRQRQNLADSTEIAKI